MSQYNVGPTTRVLVTKGAAAQQGVSHQEAAQRSEEARLAQLDRLKSAVEKLASRGDGRGLTDHYEFSLENQVGGQPSPCWAYGTSLTMAGRVLVLLLYGQALLCAPVP